MTREPFELSDKKHTLAIFEIRRFEDETGRVINVRVREPDPLAFYGNVTVVLHGQQIPLNFKIEADELSQAFACFDATKDKAGRDFVRDLEQQQRKAMLTQGLNGQGMPNGMPKRNPFARG